MWWSRGTSEADYNPLMVGVLEAVICLLSNFVAYVEVGAIDCVNWCIAGLGAALLAILPYLPTIPSFPTVTGDSGLWTWLDWFIPVSSFLALGGTILTVFVGFLAFPPPVDKGAVIRAFKYVFVISATLAYPSVAFPLWTLWVLYKMFRVGVHYWRSL